MKKSSSGLETGIIQALSSVKVSVTLALDRINTLFLEGTCISVEASLYGLSP